MKHICKKILSLVLVAMMLCSLMPAAALAEEQEEEPAKAEVTSEEVSSAEAEEEKEDSEPAGSPAETPVGEPAEEPAADEESEVSEAQITALLTQSSGAKLLAAGGSGNSGTCGTNLTWEVGGTTLTISGSGVMAPGDTVPWAGYKDEIETVVIESGVTSICDDAFDNFHEMTSVDIPDGVTAIGEKAFFGCIALTSVTIPAGVTSIDSMAFSYCGLNSITFAGDMPTIASDAFTPVRTTAYYSAVNKTYTSSNMNNYGGTITWTPVDPSGTCGENLTWVFSDGTLTITGTGAMYDYREDNQPWDDFYEEVEHLSLGAGITYIGKYAFLGCPIDSATIPENVTAIAEGAFGTCESMTSLSLPETLTTIGYNAFSNCSRLTSVELPSKLVSIDARAFESCTSLASITLPAGLSSIGEYAFFYCNSLTSVTIPAGTTAIANGLFCQCYRLSSVTIPASVESIGLGAFTDCSALADIYYGGTAQDREAITIGNSNGCLTDATWHYSVCFIGDTGYESLAKAVEAAQDGDTIVLKGDVTLTSTLAISGKSLTITDDGTARTIRLQTGGYGIDLESSASLTLSGTGAGNLTLTGKSVDVDPASSDYIYNVKSLIYVNGASLTTCNVTIRDGNNNTTSGGAINITSTGSAVLNYGTLISNCNVGVNTFLGGGVYVAGSLEMKAGAKIENCESAKNGGGVAVRNGGNFIMSGGEISGCTASSGPAVYVAGTAEISDGTVDGNVKVNGTLTITGGSFSFDPSDYVDTGKYTVSGPENGFYTVSEDHLVFTGTNFLDISSDLKFGFYVDESYTAEDLEVKFTMGSYSKTVTEPDTVKGRKCYIYDGISPQFIGTDVKAEVYVNGEVVDTFTRSILDYAKSIYANYPDLRGLICELVDYGLAANAYVKAKGYAAGTDYTRSDCYWLTESPSTAVPQDSEQFVKSGVADGYEAAKYNFNTANVIFDVTNTLTIKFTMPDDAAFYVNGTLVEVGSNLVKNGDGTYTYYRRGLKATQYLDICTFTIKDDSTTVRTMTYGIPSYVYAKNNGADGVMKDLALATYRLGYTASTFNP